MPYAFLAEQGVYDMLSAGSNKVLPVIPQLIIPIKSEWNTHQIRSPQQCAHTFSLYEHC